MPQRNTAAIRISDGILSMSMPPAQLPVQLTETDYEAIEAAVMETVRGRWFLTEYARRNRTADTRMLLGAIDRIEALIRVQKAPEAPDRLRGDLVEMSRAIARTKTEIAAIKPDAADHGKFGEASEELDSIVQSTEAATSEILAAAEQIQEIAWTLREHGTEAEVCDILDAKATEVYTACSFQDLTGQRTQKVIQVMRYLEGRINAMIDIWGLEGAMAAEAAENARAHQADSHLLNGPARPGHGLDQDDVDMVMGPAAAAAERHPAPVIDAEPVIDLAPAAEAVETAPVADLPATEAPATEMPQAEIAAPVDDVGDVADSDEIALADDESTPLQPAAPEPMSYAPATARFEPQAEILVGDVPARAETQPARLTSGTDPLAPITALGDDEKIALFS